MQPVICAICSKPFKIITYAHLKSHDITVTEYKLKYNQPMISDDILKSWTVKRSKGLVKDILTEVNAVKCNICGEFHKALNLHLKYKHQLLPSEYIKKFPEAELYSNSTKNKMKEHSFMKTQKDISFEERLGIEVAKLAKKRIGEKASKRQTGKKRSDEYKQNMRTTWNIKRVEWTDAIRKSSSRKEVKEKQSDSQKKRIVRDGYHLARGKETSLEKFVRETLEEHGYTVIRQRGTKKKTLGTIRYFDVYVPELNLIIEADGEWWHRTIDRINIDKSKTQAALYEGYSFLRISDLDFPKNNMSKDKLISLIKLTDAEKLSISNDILVRRELKITSNRKT